MSEMLRDLVVSLSLDSDNFSRNLTSINRQIQEAESEFRRAASGVDGFEKSISGSESKLSMLQQKLQLQQKAVQQYEKALVAAEKKLQTSYDKQGKLTQSLETAKQKNDELKGKVAAATEQYERFRRELGEDDSATIAVKANLDALKQEYAASSQEVSKLEGQLTANTKAMQNNADAVTRANTNLNNARAALRQTESEINSTIGQLARMRSAWTQAGETLSAFGTKCAAVAKSMEKTGKVMTKTVTTPILELGGTALKASMEFESAFTGVRKTVDATEQEYAQLAETIQQMSTEIAASTTDIAGVMEGAGQLGIANENLVDFTRTMIDLGNSTDISADEAATAIAQFANVSEMAQSDFSNFGSTLVDLGNNFATTESAIMNMGTALASAGSQVGLTEPQILGFATALSSVGLEAQAGGTAFSKAMIQMQVAVETGNDSLQDFARVSGMTTDAFKELWKSDPSAAIQSFIIGLSKMDEEGISAIATLEDMGFKEVRLRDTLLRATNATELFKNAQVTAANAWKENTALSEEAGKRYATTESRLQNLKNTAVLAAQQIGNDLTPIFQQLIDGARELVEKFMSLDEGTRQMIIKIAAVTAAAGPALLLFSRITSGVGSVSTALGKFCTSVATAGGGFQGFVSVLGKSPSIWVAIAVATVAATVAIADYVSGAKEAREALKDMAETAKDWKNTAAETFYGKSDGLNAFGMSRSDFVRSAADAQSWKDGLIAVWEDGQKETEDIIKRWTDSFKGLTSSTRAELEELKAAADEGGYTSVSKELAADIKTLDSMDKEVGRLLKKRKNGLLTDKEKIRLQELIDARDVIEVKYNLTPADADGFDAIGKKLEAEIARAHAMGKKGVDAAVYEDAIVAAGEGMAAINQSLNEQYDKEYAVIQLIEESAEKQKTLDELNARYNQQRRDAALEYAKTLSGLATPVWSQEDIQEAKAQVGDLFTTLREYSMASEEDKPAILTELKDLSSLMDEGAMTEYLGVLTQIQSLMDEGLTENEVRDLFPDIDVSSALDQFAGLADYLDLIKTDLPGLYSMFNESLAEEVLTIATDLDMTGAQSRWDAFAANPGAITTDAIVNSYTEAENAVKQQPHVDAFIDKYTEKAEGADKTSLTPEGILAYVNAYAEATTGADVSGLTPDNVTAMVSAYQELAAGADVTALKPDEITAYIMKYLDGEGVDISALSPGAVTAFVMAYEEIAGGASQTALAPGGIAAMVARYLEAESVDISRLSPDQVEGIVSAYSEATGCDKSELLTSFTAYITEYKEAEGVVFPQPKTRVVITGYDYLGFRQFSEENPDIRLEVPVRLGELEEGELGKYIEGGRLKVWQDGIEIPVKAVPEGALTPDTIASLDSDGTLHVIITPEVQGTQEAIDKISPLVDEVDKLGTTTLGRAVGIVPATTMDMIDSAIGRIESYQKTLDYNWWDKFWASVVGESTDLGILDQSMKYDFSADTVAELSAYAAEVAAAIKSGAEVSEEDMANLQNIVTFLNGLDVTGTGVHIREGIAQGMTEAGWDSDAETVASDLQAALNAAFGSHSPAQRMVPLGSNVSAGIGQGAAQYSFAGDAGTVGSNLTGAMNAVVNANTFVSTGLNAMYGFARGIRNGSSSVTAAIRSVARAAVRAAKDELIIESPSHVFRDEVGAMAMKGFGEGIVEETEAQAKVIRNAARYLTTTAQSGVNAATTYDLRKTTYNQDASATIQVDKLYVRDQQDVRSLAIEIASLTKRQQRGKGLKFA